MKPPYEDILHMPHHVSATHPRLSSRDRAAQFSPFAALNGYEAAVQETARTTSRRVELSEGEKERLNARLWMLNAAADQRPAVRITYFVPDKKKTGGAYATVSGVVKKLDSARRLVILRDGKSIPIDEVADIDGALFAETETD